MPAIHHSHPVFARVLPAGGQGHGPVHAGQKFSGGPRPSRAFCGVALDDSVRFIGSPFDGMGDVLCHQCGDVIDRMADAAG